MSTQNSKTDKKQIHLNTCDDITKPTNQGLMSTFTNHNQTKSQKNLINIPLFKAL